MIRKRSLYKMRAIAFSILITFNYESVSGQNNSINYEESKVPSYKLPDPLSAPNGKKIMSPLQWTKMQRPYMMQMMQNYVYGKFPGKPKGMRFQINSIDSSALNGLAIRKTITIFFSSVDDRSKMEVLLYLPKDIKTRVPVFTGLNFCGNQCIISEPGISLSTQWMANSNDQNVINNRATEKTRGLQAKRWPVEDIIKRGYGLATAYYGDLEPDHAEGWKTGIRSTLKSELKINEKEWSAIGAWAWGLSRMVDYLQTDAAVNAKQIILTGHSRLGKAALWAGAQDTRFAMVISNNSGEGGAALARRWYGETIETMNKQFPHWFVANFKKYHNKVNELPVDQHILLSLIAPRPLYIASAEDDKWADPKGEFLGAKNAEPVYALFGKKGLTVNDMPPVNTPVGETIRYHIRTGKHDITLYDWQQYLDFADKYFKK
ncbi:MAG TPA: hypothetical protein VMY77_06710 [Chitinophagaceae bacterium]|nr:hypothetical protein [Chitinophagaceae bacterium]